MPVEAPVMRFNDARTGDQKEWVVEAYFEIAELHAAFLSDAASLCASAALMNEINNG